jgi:hypothetical protein
MVCPARSSHAPAANLSGREVEVEVEVEAGGERPEVRGRTRAERADGRRWVG